MRQKLMEAQLERAEESSVRGGGRSADPYQLQSLDRAVAVLDLLGESEGPLGLADVCERMALL